MLLAEWVCRELSAAALRAARAPPAARARAPRVLELGCGGAPLAGLAAAALGCAVTLSDLAAVAPLAAANSSGSAANRAAVDAARAARGVPPLAAGGGDGALEVVPLDLRYNPQALGDEAEAPPPSPFRSCRST